MTSESKAKILAIDDEPTMLRVLARTLAAEGYQVATHTAPGPALEAFAADDYQVVITDLMLPEMDGFEILRRVLAAKPQVTVIVITAYSSVESAVRAMRLGAHDFIPKPFDPEYLVLVVQRALAARRLAQENIGLREALARRDDPLARIVGASPAVVALREMIAKVRDTGATVLVVGESGTGKELVARALHGGRRQDGPFVPINCGALPDQLLESELFGHEKGAFSGAAAAKPGLLETADRGTLFLDEVGTISPMMQVKLLRFLEDRSFMRLGGRQLHTVDVRVVAATNEDLAGRVQEGSFRRDLFYRLNVVTITVPPLRQRGDDVVLLARYFLERAAARLGKSTRTLDEGAVAALKSHPWEGNVRELANVIERAVILADADALTAADLGLAATPAPAGPAPPWSPTATLAQVEAAHIRHVLAHTGNNKSQAARILGIDYTTLLRKLKNLA